MRCIIDPAGLPSNRARGRVLMVGLTEVRVRAARGRINNVNIDMTSDPADPRAAQARAWALAALHLADADFALASADAGFRRYFRLRCQDKTWIVMDAPPERED